MSHRSRHAEGVPRPCDALILRPRLWPEGPPAVGHKQEVDNAAQRHVRTVCRKVWLTVAVTATTASNAYRRYTRATVDLGRCFVTHVSRTGYRWDERWHVGTARSCSVRSEGERTRNRRPICKAVGTREADGIGDGNDCNHRLPRTHADQRPPRRIDRHQGGRSSL